MKLTAVYRRVPDGYIAFVEELSGTNTQGHTLDDARANLRDAVSTVLEANRRIAESDIGADEVLREPFELAGVASESRPQRSYNLDELVSRITPENLHDPSDFGSPTGREID